MGSKKLKQYANQGLQDDYINVFWAAIYCTLLFVIIIVHPDLFSHPRWDASFDLNRDGHFSIFDLLGWLVWFLTVPGDTLLQILMSMEWSTHFFELSERSYGQIASLLMSLIFWWLLGGAQAVRICLFIIFIVILVKLPLLQGFSLHFEKETGLLPLEHML